jgi:hypothetical protein
MVLSFRPLVGDLALGVEELHGGRSVNGDEEADAGVALGIGELEGRGVVAGATEVGAFGGRGIFRDKGGPGFSAFGAVGHGFDALGLIDECGGQRVGGIVEEDDFGGALGAVLQRVEVHELVLLVFVKAEVAPGVDGAIFGFVTAKEHTAVLGALLVDEEHAGGVVAIGAGDLFAVIEGAGIFGLVGEDETRGSIGLDNVDAVDGELVEVGMTPVFLLRSGDGTRGKDRVGDGEEDGEGEGRGEDTGINGEEARVRQETLHGDNLRRRRG